MAGLREIKKEKTKKAILEYSEKVFKEKGYSRVKTAEIAKAVGIGEGTLFNYFNSKDKLFLEAVFGDFQTKKYEFNIESKINEELLADEVMNLIDFYLRKIADIDKGLLKEYFSIVFSNNKAALSPMLSLMNMDEMVMAELENFFNSLKEDSKLTKEFDIPVATTCIYNSVIVQFTTFVYDDQLSYIDVIDKLKKQVKFVIKGNI